MIFVHLLFFQDTATASVFYGMNAPEYYGWVGLGQYMD